MIYPTSQDGSLNYTKIPCRHIADGGHFYFTQKGLGLFCSRGSSELASRGQSASAFPSPYDDTYIPEDEFDARLDAFIGTTDPEELQKMNERLEKILARKLKEKQENKKGQDTGK